MTVTEGGYFLNDGQFDTENKDIKHDIVNPDSPQTIFGMIVEALKKRRESEIAPFSILSCDNVPHNGDVVRSVVVGLASQTDKDLAKWIDEEVAFPNCMVDRIVPETVDMTREFVKENYGYEDALPIFCKPKINKFSFWMVLDRAVICALTFLSLSLSLSLNPKASLFANGC